MRFVVFSRSKTGRGDGYRTCLTINMTIGLVTSMLVLLKTATLAVLVTVWVEVIVLAALPVATDGKVFIIPGVMISARPRWSPL